MPYRLEMMRPYKIKAIGITEGIVFDDIDQYNSIYVRTIDTTPINIKPIPA